ncbi:MAG: hypothetical protein WC994_05990 [Brumimicrobium sp.]
MAQENYSTAYYKKRIEKLTVQLKKLENRSKLWIIIRLFSFLSIISILYFTFPYNLFSTVGIITSTLLFLLFVKKSIENKEQLNYVQQLIEINKNEIKASQFDFSGFSKGEKYINPSHPFSYDIDLFGKNGFFQLFNRTVTKNAEELLTHYLLNGVIDPEKRILSIEELSKNKSWSQNFLAHGKRLENEENKTSIKKTVFKSYDFRSWVNAMQFILPVLTIILTGAFYYDVINFIQFIVIGIILLIPVRQTLKTTNRLHKELSNIGPKIKAMKEQFTIFENISFESPLLVEYQNELFKNRKNGKESLAKLSKIVKQAEYRDNILVAILLNFYLAWDFRLLIEMKKWKETYDYHIETWEDIVYDIETLISGAFFRYNYENQTSAPKLTDNDKKEILIKNIGHPIIPLDKLVKNDFSLTREQQFAIITGPNMAGKSTFLRSIGINIMLANAGFHVMAEEFVFPKMKLYSSMRTSDDLKDETSYFHAELLRLRFIMDAIERGEKVFIILDEILKGTNSKDKQEGSSLFLQKLNKMHVKGIIATHDLSLTTLPEKYPSMVNRYFDTEINGDEISFDYTIRDGVAKNMNASFLLRKMGLIDNP